MVKKMLTLEQLYHFCSEQKLYNFNSEETGYKVCVQVPSVYEADEEKSSDSIAYAKIKLMHTNTNRNRSNVTLDAMKNCMSGIKYKPVLANFCEIDGEVDFTSHDMEINEDGSVDYIEHQIGCFTVDEPYIEYDEEKDRHYLYAYVAIPKEYTPAFEIIERKGGTKVSAELAINKMSYDVKEKELLLEDIEVMGVTCLGKNPETGDDVQEGMEGARLDLAQFSIDKDSSIHAQNSELLNRIQELQYALDIYNKNFGKEETMDENKIQEEVTEEVVEETTEETVETLAEEVTESEETVDEEVTVEEEFSDDETSTEVAPEEDTNDEETESDDDFACGGKKKKKCSVEFGDIKKEFSVSLNAQIEALSCLVNDTYADDMTWYSVEVFDKSLVMVDMWNGRAFRQDYKIKGDVYSLKGDRVEVYATWMTADEQKAFENMKANYSSIEEKLAKYEAEPQKMDILNSSDYAQISETDEFVALKEQDAHFDMSVEELSAKCDEMLLSYAKTQKLEFSATTPKTIKPMGLPIAKVSEQKKRYGNLFNK